jgi:microcystin-dependent protein
MEPFLGQITAFGFNFPPRGWAQCDGQLLPIAQNQALFSLLGTFYGGDGRTTFGLPELRGRAALHMGAGPGLTPRTIGEKSGAETNTLNVNQLPAHTHTFAPPSNSGSGDTDVATANYPAQAEEDNYHNTSDATMGPGTTGSTGTSQSVNNMQPYQVVNFCIALQGVFPSRN